MLDQQLTVNNIEVTKDIDRELFVIGDPVKLEQVFMNLLTNARDAVGKNSRKKE